MRTAAVVDGAIAIVVDAVAADFSDRKNGLGTIDSAVRAIERSCGTWSLLALHGARRASAGIALVGLPIAVVVDCIANFARWKNRLRTKERPIRALGGADGACALLAGNHAHGTARSFVRRAIAIVVDAVADFVCRHGRGQTRDRTVGAGRRAERACTELTRHAGLSAAGIAVVGGAVAIVVLAVT